MIASSMSGEQSPRHTHHLDAPPELDASRCAARVPSSIALLSPRAVVVVDHEAIAAPEAAAPGVYSSARSRLAS